jgi:hypothetical protein
LTDADAPVRCAAGVGLARHGVTALPWLRSALHRDGVDQLLCLRLLARLGSAAAPLPHEPSVQRTLIDLGEAAGPALAALLRQLQPAALRQEVFHLLSDSPLAAQH